MIRYYSYYDANERDKSMYRPERDAIFQRQFSLAVVSQHCNDSIAKFEEPAVGTRDATRALALAIENAQPDHSAIYFGVDFDPVSGPLSFKRNLDNNRKNVTAYFAQIHGVLDKTSYRVGLYGAGVFCSDNETAHPDDLCWLSASYGYVGTQDRLDLNDYTLAQLKPLDRKCAGKWVDFDDVPKPGADLGQFSGYLDHSVPASKAWSKELCPAAYK